MFMKKQNKKRGFTITELVIVISVIAILSAVLIPTFSGLVGKSKDTAAVQGAKNAYTQYLAEFDYAENDAPATTLIYTDGNKFVGIKDGALTAAYKTEKEAVVAIGFVVDDATTADVDESNYKTTATSVDGLSAYAAK